MNEMTPFKFLIPRQKALKIILNSVKPIEKTDRIRLEESINRVLAQNIIAEKNIPPFDRAAMDGYALKAEDTFSASDNNPVSLKTSSVLHAGETAKKTISRGEVIRIATGCKIPIGANAVVMMEFTEEKGGKTSIFKPVYPGANIIKEGDDIKRNELILRKGELLTPAKIGALAALGQKKVLVYQKPNVAVIPTGTEICDLDSDLKNGQVFDINSYTLSTVLSKNGAIVTRSQIIPDQFDQLKTAITRFLDHDLIVVSGGSSVGERDLIAKVIKDIGQILFHGVQIKPGKPTLFGLINEKPIFGMPGYPTSCLSNAYVFLVPAIRQASRLPPKRWLTLKVKMKKRFVSKSGREQILPVKLIGGQAYPILKKSGDITCMTKADGFVTLPINLDVIEEGEEITVNLFE
jgi:molybdenum cofactor synthesis domain-containing protein